MAPNVFSRLRLEACDEVTPIPIRADFTRHPLAEEEITRDVIGTNVIDVVRRDEE